MFAFGPGSKAVNREFQAFRIEAERTAFSIDEFGDIEVGRYDLDDDEIDIGGRRNPESYIVNRSPVEGEIDGGALDLRDHDPTK